MTNEMRFDNFDDDFDDDFEDEYDSQPDAVTLSNTARVFDIAAMISAWQDEAPDNLYYFDTESGAVILVNPLLINLKELTDELERHKYRYLYLPKAAPGQLKDDLRDFQKSVEDKKLNSLLDMAFESPHLLSSFTKILKDGDAGKAEELKEFREGRIRLRIRQWMEANSLAQKYPI